MSYPPPALTPPLYPDRRIPGLGSQVQTVEAGAVPQYRGMIDAMRKMTKTEGESQSQCANRRFRPFWTSPPPPPRAAPTPPLPTGH